MNYKYAAFVGLAIFLTLFYGGCARKPGQKVLAVVNAEKITLEDFKTRISNLPPYYRALAKEQKERFLDEMINERLFLKEALRKKIDRNAEVKSLIKEAHNKIIIAKLIEQEVSRKSKISDKDVEEYYQAHQKEFVTLPKYKASHILVSTEAEAKEVLERIKLGEDFASVAKQVSIDPSRVNGGDLGYFTEGQMIPEFESACFKLEPQQVSDILKTQFGFHIIKLTDKKPAATKTLSEVKEQILHRLLEEAKTDKLKGLIERLRKRSKMRINKELLKEYTENKQGS